MTTWMAGTGRELEAGVLLVSVDARCRLQGGEDTEAPLMNSCQIPIGGKEDVSAPGHCRHCGRHRVVSFTGQGAEKSCAQ